MTDKDKLKKISDRVDDLMEAYMNRWAEMDNELRTIILSGISEGLELKIQLYERERLRAEDNYSVLRYIKELL